MALFYFVYALLLTLQSLHAKHIPVFAGPYIVHANRIFECGAGPSRKWDFYMRLTHFNPVRPRELQRVTAGNVTVATVYTDGLDDTYWLLCVLDSRSNNQWKENAFIFRFPDKACSMTRMHMPRIFKMLFEGYGQERECILPQRIYRFTNQTIDWYYPYFPIIPYGEYRFRLFVGPRGSRDAEVCFGVEAVVMPKV